MAADFVKFSVFLALAVHGHPECLCESRRPHEVNTIFLEPQLATGGYEIILLQDDNNRTVFGQIGRDLIPYNSDLLQVEGELELHMRAVNLTIKTLYDFETGARGIKVKWNALPKKRLEDCINFGSKHWYGGPMQSNQIYPIEKAEQGYAAYYSREHDNGAVMERYWLSSGGEYVYVYPEAPLFVDYNNVLSNHLCFIAEIEHSYSSRRTAIELEYDIWFLPDVKQAHQHAINNYLGKPYDVPDYHMVRYPIWSTWAQYFRDINENSLVDFVLQIRDYGFKNSHIEIEDLWETCYGSLTVDETKFPDFKKLVREIKSLGYRVAIWVHPFINKDCDPWYSEALQRGYLVLNEKGSPDTTWWNNNGTVAGYIDFTNVAAAEWFYRRVKVLISTYDIDSLKFDAGESSFTPQIAVQTGNINKQPHNIVEAYVRTCARFGEMTQVRTAFRTQDLPIFVRMADRSSEWGLFNGLSSIITTTFQMNLNGYPFVLPDMVGGNWYSPYYLDFVPEDLPTKELFIRWVQANTFLPTIKYSYAPWNFDDETVDISRKYTELHAVYADDIYAAMQASVRDGTPVNAPLWWLDPQDPDALIIWDEYLLGEDIIAAPVLKAGARARDIYLPQGTWLEENDPERRHVGPKWLRNHPAPLHILPYFVREAILEDNEATAPDIAAILVLSAMVANFLNAF